MGCDGGTIPRRDELVRTKKKKEQKDKEAENAAKWKYCSISSKELSPPIVSCELGRLYNKDAIIEYLLNKEESPNSSLLNHIRTLKDVIELKLTSKPDTNTNIDYKFICPIVGIEMNGNYKFIYFRQCGCVLSERAIKEIGNYSKTCLLCNKFFNNSDDDNIIIINGNDNEIDEQRKRMIERRNRQKMDKKRKHKLNDDEESTNKTIKLNEQQPSTSSNDNVKPSTSTSTSSSSSSSLNDNNLNVKTSSISTLNQTKASKNYSIKNDPTASETFKSLFTTHKSAKNKPKAHWITFNPCYN